MSDDGGQVFHRLDVEAIEALLDDMDEKTGETTSQFTVGVPWSAIEMPGGERFEWIQGRWYSVPRSPSGEASRLTIKGAEVLGRMPGVRNEGEQIHDGQWVPTVAEFVRMVAEAIEDAKDDE